MEYQPPNLPGNETSAQYQPPQQPEPPKNNTLKIILIILGVFGLACIGGVAVIVIASRQVFDQAKDAARKVSSISYIKQLGTSIMIYQADFDDVNPPAANWSTVIEPYTKNNDLFKIPSSGTSEDYYYAYAKVLDKRASTMVSYPAEVFMLFESSATATNTSGGSELLPSKSFYPKGEIVFCFADSHAKAIKEPELSKVNDVGLWPHFGVIKSQPDGSTTIE